MSAGNTKTSGSKGNNFPFQHKSLVLFKQMIDAMNGTLPLPPGGAGLAKEVTLQSVDATLISVLNAIVAADQDFEILLVRDTGNSDEVVQQITDWQTGVPVVTYKDVNGNPYVPVGPLEYLDPSAVLNLMLTELLTLNAGGQLLTEATFVAEDFATETSLAALLAKFGTLGQKTSGDSAPVVLSTEQEAILDAIKTGIEALDLDADGLSQEATQLLVKGVLDSILLDTANLDVLLSTRATEATLASLLAKVIAAPSTEAKQDAVIALLTTMDVDTSNLDVLLSTRASEATLSALASNVNADTWDTTIGNSKVFTYYAGAGAGHPAATTTEVATIAFKTGAATIFTQTFTYDAANNVLTIVVS